MNSGGLALRHPLIRLTIMVSLILLVTQAGWLEALVIFFLTGMLGAISVPPLLMFFAYIMLGAFITRHVIMRTQN